jgi:hypothetical protein
MIEEAIERFFNGKMSSECVLFVTSIVACLKRFSTLAHTKIGSPKTRGGFRKAIFTLCLKFALCAHCFSLI